MARPLAAVATISLWLALILISALALWGTRPPPALAATAPANVFSAARAIAHLEHIAKEPRPIGSDANARAREYLVEQLRGLGAEVHLEQGVGTTRSQRSVNSGLVNNIVATFPGQANSRAVMLVAHYDSVPEGPGAADDAAGLITILETVRALRTAAPMKNDLLVLFSDGEEAWGLLGARAFVASHPDLAERIGLLVNIEARGSSGPGLMFETSNDNGALIREFAASAPSPMATSLMAAIYKLLPNDTDFTPLKAAGVTGLNFAFLETYQSYHTRLDTIENLDPRSIQHLGDNVLGLVRHLGNQALPLPKERDLVYFNWFGSRMVICPVWVAWSIAFLAPILFVLGCVCFASRAGLTLGRTMAGLGVFVLQLLIFAGVVWAAFALARLIAGEFLEGDTPSNQLLFAGILGMGLGAALTSQRIIGRKMGLANLAAGQILAVSILSLLVCWFLAGGVYVLQWPMVFAMAGLLLGLRLSEPARSTCQFICLIPGLLVLVPLAYMFFAALTFTSAALAAAAFLLTTLLAMAVPLFDRLAGKRPVVVVLLISTALMIAGIRLTKWSARHPRADSLIYSVNADEKKAQWVSYDSAPDAWTGVVLGTSVRGQSNPAYAAGLEQPVLASDAPMSPLEPPSVVTSQNFVSGGEQTMTLQIASRRNARSFVVRVPGDVKFLAAGWNGNVQKFDDPSPGNAPRTFRFFNAPPEGASLELRFSPQSPLRIWVADSTPGLPAIAPLPPRPNDTTPGVSSDNTLVSVSLEL